MKKNKLLSQKGSISTVLAIIFIIVSFSAMAAYWGSWFRSYQERKPKEGTENIIENASVDINISSEPSGAQIILDGEDTKKTSPALLSDLKYGSHAITLTHDEAQNWTGKIGAENPLIETITIKAIMNKK